MQSKWLSHLNRDYFCCEFSRFDGDHAALAEELVACREVFAAQHPSSLLVAVDLTQAPMTSELTAFFADLYRAKDSPVQRMAIIGVLPWRNEWFQVRLGIQWPRQSKQFQDWDRAKDWLLAERW